MPPLSTLPELLVFSILSISTWILIHHCVRIHGPIPYARKITKLNSWFYTAISFLMLLAMLTANDHHDQTESFYPRYIFHVSKFYEFLDILLVCASGGHVGLHFGFHHLTTPYLTFFRFLSHHEGWRVFASLNTFHHVMMYAYFGGAGIVKPFLPWTGGLQLLASMGVDFLVCREKWAGRIGGELWPNVFSGFLVATYFVLYLRDLKLGKV